MDSFTKGLLGAPDGSYESAVGKALAPKVKTFEKPKPVYSKKQIRQTKKMADDLEKANKFKRKQEKIRKENERAEKKLARAASRNESRSSAGGYSARSISLPSSAGLKSHSGSDSDAAFLAKLFGIMMVIGTIGVTHEHLSSAFSDVFGASSGWMTGLIMALAAFSLPTLIYAAFKWIESDSLPKWLWVTTSVLAFISWGPILSVILF